jgi:hypothetical protein
MEIFWSAASTTNFDQTSSGTAKVIFSFGRVFIGDDMVASSVIHLD